MRRFWPSRNRGILGIVSPLLLASAFCAPVSADCVTPTTWPEYIRYLCGSSSNVVEGVIRTRTQTAESLGPVPGFRYTMESSNVFKGSVQHPSEIEFYMSTPDSSDSFGAAHSEVVPIVGQTWLVFGTIMPSAFGDAFRGKLLALVLGRVDPDSVRFVLPPRTVFPLPSTPSAPADTVRAGLARCTSTKSDSLRREGR
jgi:hypothetical protein